MKGSNKRNKRTLEEREKHASDSRSKKKEKTIQLCFYVYLLNKSNKVGIIKPMKCSKKTYQSYTVESIDTGKEVLQIEELLKARCQPQLDHDKELGLDLKKAMRRYSSKKIFECNNYLNDLCMEIGYFFNYKKSLNGNRENNMEIIDSVFFNYKLIFNQEQVMDIGKQIITYLGIKLKGNYNNCTLSVGELNTVVHSVS